MKWWRHDGPTDLDNLLLICGFHHTLIHDHGYQVTAAGHGSFTYARPDTTPVPTAGPPATGSADDLVAAHTAHRISDRRLDHHPPLGRRTPRPPPHPAPAHPPTPGRVTEAPTPCWVGYRCYRDRGRRGGWAAVHEGCGRAVHGSLS